MGKQDFYELKTYFTYKLENLYGVQEYLNNQLPDMENAACMENVKSVLVDHQKNTFFQIIRIKAIFDHLSFKPHLKHPPVIKRIVKDAKKQIKETKYSPVLRDISLIMIWREIDHFNIAAYANLLDLSSTLDLKKISQSLYIAMENEMEVDTDLKRISILNGKKLRDYPNEELTEPPSIR